MGEAVRHVRFQAFTKTLLICALVAAASAGCSIQPRNVSGEWRLAYAEAEEPQSDVGARLLGVVNELVLTPEGDATVTFAPDQHEGKWALVRGVVEVRLEGTDHILSFRLDDGGRLLVLGTGSSTSVLSKTMVPQADQTPEIADTIEFGRSHRWDDGLWVTVSAPTTFKPRQPALGKDREALVFEVNVRNGTDAVVDASTFLTRVISGGEEANQIMFDAAEDITPPTAEVLPGERLVYKIGYEVKDMDDLHLIWVGSEDRSRLVYSGRQP